MISVQFCYIEQQEMEILDKICEKCEGKGPTIHVFKLTNWFRFGIYVNKELIKGQEIKDPSIFVFSLTNKKKYFPKDKNKIHLNSLFNTNLFRSECNGNCISVNNKCLNSNEIWINYQMLSNCNQVELCGLYKEDFTSLLDYEVF
jgi:hypothetical protein